MALPFQAFRPATWGLVGQEVVLGLSTGRGPRRTALTPYRPLAAIAFWWPFPFYQPNPLIWRVLAGLGPAAPRKSKKSAKSSDLGRAEWPGPASTSQLKVFGQIL